MKAKTNDSVSSSEFEKFLENEGISTTYASEMKRKATTMSKEQFNKWLRYEGIIGYDESIYNMLHDSKSTKIDKMVKMVKAIKGGK